MQKQLFYVCDRCGHIIYSEFKPYMNICSKCWRLWIFLMNVTASQLGWKRFMMIPPEKST